jgi:predicted  nucleic acid-binding Zn-ribbon protein
VDEQLDAKLSEIDANTQRDLAGRESRRQREREDASELNEATLAEIGRRFEEAQDALRSGTDADIAETQRKLDEARAKLDAALERARQQRAEAEEEPGSPRRTPQELLDDFQERIAGIGQTIARGVTVRGTFNASAAQGLLGSADAQERTADASEQTARNTKRLVDAARTGGLTFG